MDIFGFTPIDAALSAWGLNVSQSLVRFFFTSHLGFVAFAIGFGYSVWRSAREANYRHFAVFAFICIAGWMMIVVPSRQEPHIKSVMEVYGTSNTSTQDVKNSQTTMNVMPLVLSYFGQMADAMNIGIISAIDNVLADDFRFLDEPLGIQRLALQANQFINTPIIDISLKKDLNDFIYAHYLPALAFYTNRNPTYDLRSLSPGSVSIVHQYSQQGKQKWDEIKNNLLQLLSDPQGPWMKIRQLLQHSNISSSNIDNQILDSIFQGQLRPRQENLYWFLITGVHSFFLYIYGWVNFCLYVSFPFFMFAVLIFHRFSILLHYLEIFLWIKSWGLIAALAHYVSMMVFHIQIHNSGAIYGIWEYPYFSAVSAFILCVLPIFSFIGFRQCFQIINKR